jgi:hypothetical protein
MNARTFTNLPRCLPILFELPFYDFHSCKWKGLMAYFNIASKVINSGLSKTVEFVPDDESYRV